VGALADQPLFVLFKVLSQNGFEIRDGENKPICSTGI
jgi:hypothetical protein